MPNEPHPILLRLPPETRHNIEAACDEALRPGFQVLAQRTWPRNAIARRFSRSRQPLSLARTASKLGGAPYLTDPAQWPRPRVDGEPLCWLGQLDFAEMRPHLAPLPERGVLGIWFDRGFWRGRAPLVTRWFADADASRAVDPPKDAPPVTWLFETALRFEPTRWLSVDAAEEIARSIDDPALEDRLVDALFDIGRTSTTGDHEVLPTDRTELERSVGAAALAGRTVLYRVSYENEAGFSWGTNTFYLHVADEDLARGRLDGVVGAVANA